MKFILFKKQKTQKIIGLAIFIGVLLIIIIVLLFLKNKNINNQLTEPGSTVLKPVFLDDKEKAAPDINVKPEIKIQVLKRDANGKVVLYKVINNDSDIVADLNQVEAQRPEIKK